MIWWFQLAERYSWTPGQCDDLDLEYALELPHMIAGRDAAQAEASRRAAGPPPGGGGLYGAPG